MLNKNLLLQNSKDSISVAELNMRTTSSLESINSQMGRSFPKHGHVWQFIEQLKYHEYSKSRDMLSNSKSTNIKQKKNGKVIENGTRKLIFCQISFEKEKFHLMSFWKRWLENRFFRKIKTRNKNKQSTVRYVSYTT